MGMHSFSKLRFNGPKRSALSHSNLFFYLLFSRTYRGTYDSHRAPQKHSTDEPKKINIYHFSLYIPIEEYDTICRDPLKSYVRLP